LFEFWKGQEKLCSEDNEKKAVCFLTGQKENGEFQKLKCYHAYYHLVSENLERKSCDMWLGHQCYRLQVDGTKNRKYLTKQQEMGICLFWKYCSPEGFEHAHLKLWTNQQKMGTSKPFSGCTRIHKVVVPILL